MVEMGGYGYEFETEHYGGPFDGLTDTVVSFNEFPPRYHVRVVEDEGCDEKKRLGQKLLDAWKLKNLPDKMWVAVYKIEGRPEEYDNEQVVPYHYVATMQSGEFKEKHGEE